MTNGKKQCKFTTTYYDYETGEIEQPYRCNEDEEIPGSDYCIFHNKNYLQWYPERRKKVKQKLMDKVNKSVGLKEPLFCIGYHLPDITINKDFTKPAYFLKCIFQGEANFSYSTFSREVTFSEAKFSGKADFSFATFSGETSDFSDAKFCNQADFSFATFSGEGAYFNRTTTFSREVTFSEAKFSGKADISKATFCKKADFSKATFSREAYFSSKFNAETYFNYMLFEDGKKILFETEDLSKVSFANTDITRVRFIETATWGKEDKFKVFEEEMLEQLLKYSFDWEKITTTYKQVDRLKGLLRQMGVNWEEDLQFTKGDKTIYIKSTSNSLSVDDSSSGTTKQVSSISIKLDDNSKKAILSIDGNKSYEFIVKEYKDKLMVYPVEEVSLGNVMAVYRNLRENYEFRLRYDEAGKFFIREMELKRNYREKLSIDGSKTIVKRNGWLRRNLSLTGLYYHLSKYGENLLRPTLVGMAIVFGSTLFWLIQNNPTAEPSLSVVSKHSSHISNFINMTYLSVWNNTHVLKAFERSFSDFLPLLPQVGDIKVGIFDFIIKIVGGALTFGLLAVALRRKFERKYTR